MKYLVCKCVLVLMLAGQNSALGQQPAAILDDTVEDSTDITATLTARTISGFKLPASVAVEVGEDMVADKNLRDQALRSLNTMGIAVSDDASLTLQIDFDAHPLGDTGRQVSGLGNREVVDDRRLYSGDADPYTGESYLSEQEFGVAIGIGRGNRKALGVDYVLTARLYTLTGDVMWSGSVGAEIVGATPEVVGEAMLDHLLGEMGNSVAAKEVVLNSDPSMSIGTQPSNRERRPVESPRRNKSSGSAPAPTPSGPPAVEPNQGLF